jgi:hypothetical protein
MNSIDMREEDDEIALADRRREERKPTDRMTGRLYAPGDQKHLFAKDVTIVDLSLHGAGLRSTLPMKVGKLYGLELRGNWMNLSSRIRVVSCREGEGGEYDVGVKFC